MRSVHSVTTYQNTELAEILRLAQDSSHTKVSILFAQRMAKVQKELEISLLNNGSPLSKDPTIGI